METEITRDEMIEYISSNVDLLKQSERDFINGSLLNEHSNLLKENLDGTSIYFELISDITVKNIYSYIEGVIKKDKFHLISRNV